MSRPPTVGLPWTLAQRVTHTPVQSHNRTNFQTLICRRFQRRSLGCSPSAEPICRTHGRDFSTRRRQVRYIHRPNSKVTARVVGGQVPPRTPVRCLGTSCTCVLGHRSRFCLWLVVLGG